MTFESPTGPAVCEQPTETSSCPSKTALRLPLAAQQGSDVHAREDDYRLHRRFDRMGRLAGDDGMARLFGAHVMIVGVGGVGSFAAESLARSGVGRLTLVDFDRVCVTNSNRQLQALKTTVGEHKAKVLAARLREINPQGRFEAITEFYSPANAADLFALQPDWVVDAIDNVSTKCHLLSECGQRAIPVVSSMGSAGRVDPTLVTITDLAATKFCPLAQDVRRILRHQYGFPTRGKFGIRAVYSLEQARPPVDLHYDNGRGFRCVCPGGINDVHSCDNRRVIYGTASFVTGTYGLHAASVVVRDLVRL
jgi:tRNA A37 threonylcarbamoyladenosine dehydratase